MNQRACFVRLIIWAIVLGSGWFVWCGEKTEETKWEHDRRSSRIRYLNMRQKRYQNVVDTNIFKLATLYIEDREFNKALTVLQTVSTRSPDEQSRWTALYTIGDIEWVEFNRLPQAIQAFERVKGTLEPLCYSGLIELYGKLGMETDFKTQALAGLNRLEQTARNKKSNYERKNDLAKITFMKTAIFRKYGERDKAIQACRVLIDSVKDAQIKKRAEREIQRLEGGR